MILTVNILNKNKFDLNTNIELTLNDYKDEISKKIIFHIDSYIIKHQKYGTICWDTKLSTIELLSQIYLVHTIRG